LEEIVIDAQDKERIMPVTIKVKYLHWKSFSVPLEFDSESNLQMGDEWQINQPFDKRYYRRI